ncbi:g3522 [Coccomyxa elongata]
MPPILALSENFDLKWELSVAAAQIKHGRNAEAGDHGQRASVPAIPGRFNTAFVVATLPESTTGPLSIAFTPALNYPYGNPVPGFQTSPTWNQFLNTSSPFFSPTTAAAAVGAAGYTGVAAASAGLKFFGECKQNILTLQATCSFVFDYSTRRMLDLLSKASPAGGIPLGGTVTFQFCTLALGNSQVSSPTCFESRGGAPKPVIVKISSKEPADVVPQIGFNACYKDVVGSPDKCLAFAIIQSCAASQGVAYGSSNGPVTASNTYAPTTAGTMVGSGQSMGATTQTAQGSQGYDATIQSQGSQAAGQAYGAATQGSQATGQSYGAMQTQGSQAASQTSRAANAYKTAGAGGATIMQSQDHGRKRLK